MRRIRSAAAGPPSPLADGSAVPPAPALPEGQLSAEAIAILDEAYKWLLVREQLAQGDQLNALRWNVGQLRGDVTERGSVVDRVVHRLEQDELLLIKWSPHGLKRELDQWLWKDDAPHVSAAQLWDYFARYPYLSRLQARDVLASAIKDGARTDDYWGYAKGVQDGNYEGLSLAAPVSEVYFDGSYVLVRPETAKQQLQQAGSAAVAGDSAAPSGPKSAPASGDPTKKLQRFHGSVRLDPKRLGTSSASIGDEILQRLEAFLART